MTHTQDVTFGPIDLSHEDGVTRIVMNDVPGRNALSATFVEGLIATFATVADDPNTRAVVLEGLGDVFCAGAGQDILAGLLNGEINVSELGLPRLLLACPVPVITAMTGSAVGGGFALGLAGDVVILNERARYGFNFMDLGLTPGMGVTWLAGAKLGQATGDELMYSTEYRRGRAFDGAPGINHVVGPDKVTDLAHDIARRIAEKPRHALVLLKANQAAPQLKAFDAARENEIRMHRARLAQPDTADLIRRNYIE